MKIVLVTLGEIKDKNLQAIEDDYLKRISPYFQVKIKELKVKRFSSLPPEERKSKESDLLRETLEKGDKLILLDERGRAYDSQGFAVMLKKHMIQSSRRLVFAIGGVYGWSAGIKKEAHHVISLSSLTFTYALARVILIEQLYRGATIINGTPYHKD